jgi:hypothetical protein
VKVFSDLGKTVSPLKSLPLSSILLKINHLIFIDLQFSPKIPAKTCIFTHLCDTKPAKASILLIHQTIKNESSNQNNHPPLAKPGGCCIGCPPPIQSQKSL